MAFIANNSTSPSHKIERPNPWTQSEPSASTRPAPRLVPKSWRSTLRKKHSLVVFLTLFLSTPFSLALFGLPAGALSQDASPPTTVAAVELPDAPVPSSPSLSLSWAPTQSPAPPVSASSEPKIPGAPTQDQSLPGTIRGTVVDRDGAVYQGVRITLTQPTPIALPERSAVSDSNGQFQFAPVPAGVFTLTVSSEGFTTQTVTGTLHSDEVYEVPAILLPFAANLTEVRVSASRQEIAQAQVRQEEQQRVLGVIPNFYVVYAPNAAPLNKRQKFDLAWKSSIDPITILSAGFFAGIEQANNDFKGYGQGTKGYAKRFGANYADDFISTMIGGAILPSWWKQDPRYFYKGTGTTKARILYAIANAVICKGDNGRWQANYSAIVGSLASAGISNLYYPASDRNGAGLTFENTLIGIASTAGGNLFQEFLVKKLTPRIPKYTTVQP